jgi:hypothetical protein
MEHKLILLLASLVVAVPGVWMCSRGRLWQAGLFWVTSPLLLFLGWVLWALATDPAGQPALAIMAFTLEMVSHVAALPLLAACVAGLGLAFLLRKQLRPVWALFAPVRSGQWRPLHVGVANDAVRIDGIELWKHTWHSAGLPQVPLPHPAHPSQMHHFDIFDAGTQAYNRRFAAAELSNNVWGFYVSNVAGAKQVLVSEHGELHYYSKGAPLRVSPFGVLAIVIGIFISLGLLAYAMEQLRPRVPFTPSPAVRFTPMPTTPSIPGRPGNKR